MTRQLEFMYQDSLKRGLLNEKIEKRKMKMKERILISAVQATEETVIKSEVEISNTIMKKNLEEETLDRNDENKIL